MKIPMCAICCAETDDLILLEEPASLLIPHGPRMHVEAGNHVCPEHRPIIYLSGSHGAGAIADRAPARRKGGGLRC